MEITTKKNQEFIASMVDCFNYFKILRLDWIADISKDNPSAVMVKFSLERAGWMAQNAIDYAEMAGLDPITVVKDAVEFAEMCKEEMAA